MALTKILASMVSFLQSGTGAVIRTLQDRLRDSVSVKDFGAKGDWVPTVAGGAGSGGSGTDDTAAFQACAAHCRTNNKVMRIPDGRYRVSSTLDLGSITVEGSGQRTAILYMSEAQVDVIKTTTGNMNLRSFGIHGGWDGITAGQLGNAIIQKTPDFTTFGYNVHIEDMFIQYAKRSSIVYDRAGYSSVRKVKSNASGLHGLELIGYALPDVSTTVSVDGSCTFSDCPNGYSTYMKQCQNVSLRSCTGEYTYGILIEGNDNRSIVIDNYYQENTAGGLYLSTTGAGVGLTVCNSFGGGRKVQELPSWNDVNFYGNSNLVECSSSANAPRNYANTSAEVVTAAAFTGSFTGATLTLPPGAWVVTGTMQVQSVSALVMADAGILITTDVTASGYSNATNGGFAEGSDMWSAATGTDKSQRLTASTVYTNATGASVNLYLRGYIGSTAGQAAYKARLRAIKM